MNRNIATLSKGLFVVVAAGALASVALVARSAQADEWVPPPAEVVVSSEPVWYEGHAHYWYGNHWYWRDEHGGWQHYDHEPAYFAGRRGPVRHYWGAHPGHRW
jgi:hypothetical protein